MIERDLVANFWKPLTVQAELLDHALSLDLDVDSVNAEMPIGFIETFLELVLGHTLVICELCLTRSKRGCGSAIPLPVNRHDTLGRVWMCRPCRREYYEIRPEPKRPFKAEDRVSLYGLPGYPAKISRSTGPPAPRRRYYPRRQWGEFGSSRYYDDHDVFDSTDDEFGDYGSDDFGGYGSDRSGGCYMATETDSEEDDFGRSGDFGDYGSDYFGGCYFATEADLEEDDRWTKEADADAREAAAKEAARIPVGVMKDASSAVIRDTPGDTFNLGQGVQDFADIERSQVCQGNETVGAANVKHDKPASIVESEVDDTVVTEGSAIGQSNNDAGGTSLDGVPEIKLAADSDEVEGSQAELGGEADDITMDGDPISDGESVNANAELVDEQQMDEVNDEEEDGEMDEAEEDMDEAEEDMDEEEEDMDEENEDEDEDEEEANGHANQAIIQEARRHHGGDIGIQTHSRNNTQLWSKLWPLRYRLMKTRLGLLGLHLRNDSKLSQDYLNGLMDDPFKIADVMKQMQWYFTATEYPSYIEDNDSSTAKSAAMEQWIEELIGAHGENAKTAYRGLDAEENPEDAVVNVMDANQPPKSLWLVLDMWIDHRLKGDQSWSPAAETFAVRVATDDLKD
ncbi:hypothetical protein BGZ97_004793 [Linnemannia gamsii]|uniref:Uncharacterized protein n=1 Tax=Linnemannia gamsii TaxID=64522 RepID=A0A9P6QW67_9FUNG|nr:hypothetical protein BGZ97_004793 [Linnemannia gamsii]